MKKNLFEMGANFDEDSLPPKKEKKREKEEIILPNKHSLYIQKEKRRGKVVTIVKPFYLQKDELKTTLKTLKKKLGTGGTIKEDSLEFQGDISPNLKEQLIKLDFKFKN